MTTYTFAEVEQRGDITVIPLSISWQDRSHPEHWSLDFRAFPNPGVFYTGVGVPRLDQIIILLGNLKYDCTMAGVVYAAAMAAYQQQAGNANVN